MKRRILAMILGMVMVLSMAACAGNNDETIKPGEPLAETTEPQIKHFILPPVYTPTIGLNRKHMLISRNLWRRSLN